jgi:Queuosine biosynthesis protein QueC
MTRIICHADVSSVPAAWADGEVHVVLYGQGTVPAGVARIGSMLMDPVSRLKLAIRTDAFDFLTITLAVTAADTFVLRSEADDRWCRRLDLTVPLINPRPWNAVRETLERGLRFLSGDEWTLEFRSGGPRPPAHSVRDRRRIHIDLSRADCACLFSGGLDSYIGVLDLLDAGRGPILVSHAYRGDRKYQNKVAAALPVGCPRFAANAHPTWTGPTDVSMRTRSFNFLGYGALAATAIAQFRGLPSVDLIVPENGFIALNPPLTPRRIGSHSTRTTHPCFIQTVQGVMDDVGLPVAINNPLRHQTKGEMMSRHAAAEGFAATAVETVSCGKWKRKNQQCGHCVPCLIRRAAFHTAAITDTTPYRAANLLQVMADPRTRDDLSSVLRAVRHSRTARMEPWVLQAGPLPDDPSERQACVDVFRRGIVEIGDFLRANGFP